MRLLQFEQQLYQNRRHISWSVQLSHDTPVSKQKAQHSDLESPWSKLANFRFGLSDLFIIVAFCAGLSLVYSKSWSVPFITILAISLSLVIGFFFVVGGLGKRNPTFMLTWLFLSGVVLGCFGSSGLFCVAVAHSIGAILLCFVPRELRTPRFLMRSSMLLIVLGLVYWTSQTPYHLDRLMNARVSHPIEDISMRLESTHRADHQDLTTDGMPNIRLAASVDAQLTASELTNRQDFNYFGRAEELKKIHGKEYEKFVRQLGFGAVRMRGVGGGIDPPPLPRVSFESAFFAEKDHQWRWVLYNNDEPAPVHLKQINDLSELHFAGESDFLNANMFGFVAKARPEKVHAAGFVPHAFHGGFEVIKRDEFISLQMKKLELVSLLKFEKPKAYVLDHLPRMDELSEEGITTRELTQFELTALIQLRSDEDVVIEQRDDTILMMGSLRAATHCLNCHTGSRGELLGAFSYQFTTDN